jgi:hypothetical protein
MRKSANIHAHKAKIPSKKNGIANPYTAIYAPEIPQIASAKEPIL